MTVCAARRAADAVNAAPRSRDGRIAWLRPGYPGRRHRRGAHHDGRLVARLCSSGAHLGPGCARQGQPYGTADFGGLTATGSFHSGTTASSSGPQLGNIFCSFFFLFFCSPCFFFSPRRRPGVGRAHTTTSSACTATCIYATPGLQAQHPEVLQGFYFRRPGCRTRQHDLAAQGDVTIIRDPQYGSPAHLIGTHPRRGDVRHRYAAGGRTLFFLDLLRHLGRAAAGVVRGGWAGRRNRAFRREPWRSRPTPSGPAEACLCLPGRLVRLGAGTGHDSTRVSGVNQ